MISKLHKEQFYFAVSAFVSWIINTFIPSKTPKSILVIKMDEIGDMVYALHVFNHLRERYPKASINLLCKNFVLPLVKNNPYIDHIFHEIPKKQKFDMIVELRGNWDTLKFALKNIPNRRLDRASIRIRNKMSGGQKHEYITNYEIIEPLLPAKTWPLSTEIFIDQTTKEEVNRFISKHKLTHYAVIHCGARKKLRQWPNKQFAEVCQFLQNHYGLDIIFAGTAEDDPTIDEIIKIGNLEAIVCTSNFTLLHFAELVSRAVIFIGNESGPLHIAAAMETPLVGIYGPGVPTIFYPLGPKSKVCHHILECNPCDQVHCVRPENPCINLVTQLEVQEKIKEVLAV